MSQNGNNWVNSSTFSGCVVGRQVMSGYHASPLGESTMCEKKGPAKMDWMASLESDAFEPSKFSRVPGCLAQDT